MIPRSLVELYGRASDVVQHILGPEQPLSEAEEPILPRSSSSLSVASTQQSTPSYRSSINHTLLRNSFPKALHPFLCVWVVVFIWLICQQYYFTPTQDLIPCTASPWDDWPPDNCGINGERCAEDLTSLADRRFRCMSGCKDTRLGNERWIGNERVNGVPLLIGGGDMNHTYRADSWICAAAIHSNLISSSLGGCVTVHPLPYPAGHSSFISSAAHGLTSTAFSQYFPGAFTLSHVIVSGCWDLHFIVMGFNAVCLLILTLFLRPPSSLLFTILLVLGYFQITLFSDVPHYPPDWQSLFGGLIPVLIAGYWIWKQAFFVTLPHFHDAPFTLALWQGAGYWVGVESSTVFARFPISRLGYGTLTLSGFLALMIIVGIIHLVVGYQALAMRKQGLLRYYLVRYLPFLPILLILSNIPSYTLRLHHYLLALLAIPVLSLPNRLSLVLQAFMLGLWLDGVGRWGWASFLEKTSSLLGDAPSGSWTPTFFPNLSSPHTLSWSPITPEQAAEDVTGYSVLVNDMQAFAGWVNNTIDLKGVLRDGVNYFRIAYERNGLSMDFSDPIVRWENGTWGGMGEPVDLFRV
ncbi:vacuolar protein [Cryptococcus neoformans Ze90-1]|nr:vacuolar protein [Cryptococcus neoformans var. grubii Ze90-1]